MPAANAALAPRKPTARSAITNGSTLLDGIDGRSAQARRFRDVLSEIVSDLGGGDHLSEGQRQLARRCALISVECERLEGRAIAEQSIDLDLYGTLTDRLGRAFQRLSLKRQPPGISPRSLRDRLLAEPDLEAAA